MDFQQFSYLYKAREVLKEALKKDKENVRLQLQLLEVETTNEVVNESRVLKVFDSLIKNEKNEERKYQFSQVCILGKKYYRWGRNFL